MIPAYEVSPVDATGAGDAFVAGFLAGVVRGYGLEEAGRLANAVGALCTQAIGCTAGIRSLEQTQRFQRRTPLRDLPSSGRERTSACPTRPGSG